MSFKIIILSVLASVSSSSYVFGQSETEIRSAIKSMQERGKKEKWTFSVGDSPVLREQVEHQTGLVVPDNWREGAKFAPRMADSDTKFPERWDWRERGAVTPVKNQGSCGSCWAFGTIAAFESAVMIATGKLLSFSEQQLVSCSNYGTCGGGYYAFGFYTSKGANYTSDFPYSGTDRSCKSAALNEKLVDWSYVGSENGTPSVNEIKAAIFNHGTVATTVYAGGAFMYYKSGVYNSCVNGGINHLVALVGWDDSTQSWIMKNSWGTGWGEDGYMRIKYTDSSGRKCNNIGASAAYAVYNQKLN